MREGEVHPAILIEVERDGAHRRRGHENRPGTRRAESAFALVQENFRAAKPGDNKIDGAVIVQIAPDCGDARTAAGKPCFPGPIRERAVAVVAPEDVARRRGILGEGKWLRWILDGEIHKSRDVEIEIAVVVVINESHAENEPIGVDARFVGHVLEGAIALVVKELDAAIEADSEVGLAVVVVIAHGAAHALAVEIELRRLGYIYELSAACVLVERGVAFAVGVDDENVGLAVAVIVEDACAAADEIGEQDARFLLSFGRHGASPAPNNHRRTLHHGRMKLSLGRHGRLRRKSGERRDVHVVNGNGGRNRLRSWRHHFGKRVFPLLAVDETDRRAEFLRCDVLEAIEMLFGACFVARPQKRLREAELGGSMEGIALDGASVCGHGLVVAPLLGFDQADEILSVGVGGIEFRDLLEIRYGGVRMIRGFFEQPEIEPRAQGLRFPLRRFFEHLPGIVEELHVQEGDAHVEAGDISLRIEDAGALEFAKSRFELLAVHQRHTEIIFADNDGARIGRRRSSRSLRGLRHTLVLRLLAGSGESAGRSEDEDRDRRESAHPSLGLHKPMAGEF